MVGHALAWVLGEELPVISIGFERPASPRDSGFTIIYSDAPYADELEQLTEDDLVFMCLDCLLEALAPDVGHGLDLAREYGVADLDENGAWVVGDLSRLEPR